MKKSTVILSCAALVLIGLGAAGWTAWNSTSRAHGASERSFGVRVEVVAPTEPELVPGTILAVGDLRDGYEHDPERMDADQLHEVNDIESAWLELMPPLPSMDVTGQTAAPVKTAPAPSRPQLAPDDYGYGFDAPQPDYVAERLARIAARDAGIDEDRAH